MEKAGSIPLFPFVFTKIIADRRHLIIKANDPAAACFRGNGGQGKHVARDHIPLHGGEIGIMRGGVSKRVPWVCEAMIFMRGVLVVPIVKIIIVQQGTAHQLPEIGLAAKALMVTVAKIGNLERMVKDAALHDVLMHFRLSKCF